MTNLALFPYQFRDLSHYSPHCAMFAMIGGGGGGGEL